MSVSGFCLLDAFCKSFAGPLVLRISSVAKLLTTLMEGCFFLKGRGRLMAGSRY